MLDRSGTPVVIDGNSLSIPAVTAAARYGAGVNLDDSPEVRNRVQASRQVIVRKVDSEKSVYGVSTGFGGSGKSLRFSKYPTIVSLAFYIS